MRTKRVYDITADYEPVNDCTWTWRPYIKIIN